MTRGIPVLFAALLLCSLPAMTVIAAGPDGATTVTDDEAVTHQPVAQQFTPTTVENTTNRLQIPGDTTSSSVEQTRDLSTALAASDASVRVDHEQYAIVDREFAEATREERDAMILAASDRLEERIDELKTREETVVSAHAAGDVSDRQLIQMLFQTTREATVLLESINELSVQAGQVPGASAPVEEKTGELEVYQTAIRTQLEAATLGDRTDPLVLTVETGTDGYSVSTLEGTYLRETVRFDNRDLTRTDRFSDLTDALDTAEEAYPWAFETRGSGEAAERSAVQLYWAWYEHDHGELLAYLDGGTGDVYRELQDLNYDALPIVDTDRWTEEDLELSIEQTPANGPAEVTVVDNESGEPEVATITVDGIELGETDDDGALWYVPPGEEYELVAETEFRTIEVTVNGPTAPADGTTVN